MVDHELPFDAGKAGIEVVAPTEVVEVLSRMGRTEDVRFSPDNRRLAIAAYIKNACFLFDIEIDRSSSRPVVRISDYLEIRSDAIRQPHGLDFIEENLLLVANRKGSLTLFTIPERTPGNHVHHIQPLQEIRQASLLHKLNSPGSLCVVDHDREQAEVLVCNNYSHRITRHVLPLRAGFSLPNNSILLHEGLRIPDGIAITPDKSWLAVGNHNTKSVLMFDRRANLKPTSVAGGNLLNAGYPHGIRFSGDGRRLYAADAGAPYVHVYDSEEQDWSGDREPVASLLVLNQERFLKGHVNPQEGGPKGIDLTSAGDVLAITCEEQPLAFFHLAALGV